MVTRKLSRYADMLAALGSESRLEIMRLLLRASPDGLTVGEIQSATDIPGSTLSHHLERLRREGLVGATRDRQWIWYKAELGALERLLAFLYADCCQGKGKLSLVSTGTARR